MLLEHGGATLQPVVPHRKRFGARRREGRASAFQNGQHVPSEQEDRPAGGGETGSERQGRLARDLTASRQQSNRCEKPDHAASQQGGDRPHRPQPQADRAQQQRVPSPHAFA
ncbi:hypothetical protein OY671_012742, partial [Metschnikowia pulcherrima]